MADAIARLVELRNGRPMREIARAMQDDGDEKCDGAAVWAIEHGAEPRGIRFTKYARVLGITPDELARIYEEHRASAAEG